MPRSWVVIGCGGHGREVADVLHAMGESVLGFLDDNPERQCTVVAGLPVLGRLDWIQRRPGRLVIALGIGGSQARRGVVERLKALRPDLDFPPVIHPNSTIGSRVSIGEGALIQAGCVLTCDIELGAFVVLNIGVGLSHDVRVGDFATLAPRAHLAGAVHVHPMAEIGMGTLVIPNRQVGEAATTGAGAVVIRDAKPIAKVAGVPAKEIRATFDPGYIKHQMPLPKPELSIIGAGTYGSVIKELAEECGYQVSAFYDKDPEKSGSMLGKVPVFSTNELACASLQGRFFAIAIGNNRARTQLASWITSKGGQLPTLINPKAYVSPSASIGVGCFIHAHACIWAEARLGDFAIVSPLAAIAHHAVLGEGAMSAVGSTVGACVEIGMRSFVGMGSTVSTTAHRVEADSIIGAGSTVIRTVANGSTVVGTPARLISKH